MSKLNLSDLAAIQRAKHQNLENEDGTPAALESQTPEKFEISDTDTTAKEAFDAVLAALAVPETKSEVVVTAASTEVRPAVKQAATAPSTQPMRELVADAAKTVAAAPSQAYFISRYPTLTLYVDVGFREQHQGARIVRNVPIRFVDGQFRTDNAQVAEALRNHSKFGGMFQEARSREIAAYVAGAAKARTMLRNQVTSGPAASSDGNDHAMMMREAELGGVEQKLFAL